ncbi:Structural polyprotein [Trichinella pseudospiralis]
MCRLMNRSNVPKETPVDWLWTPVLEKVIRHPLKSLMATYLRYTEGQTNAFDALALCPDDYYLNVSLLL